MKLHNGFQTSEGLFVVIYFFVLPVKHHKIDQRNSEWSICFHRVLSDMFNATLVMLTTNIGDFPALERYSSQLKMSQSSLVMDFPVHVPERLMQLKNIYSVRDRSFHTGHRQDIWSDDDKTEVCLF